MGREGYIKIWRKLFEHPIWLNSTPEQKCILIVLMELANHEAKKWEWQGKEFVVQRGQMVTSIASIMKECGLGISEQNVRTALNRFKKLGFLTYESTKTGRLITIENYDKWQSADAKPNKEPHRHLTKTSQTPNRHLTTNKNEKNEKNVRSNIYTPDLSDFPPDMQNAIMDWLTYKDERKESYKPTGLRSWISQVKKFNKIYEDKYIIEAIEKSMSCQYKGVVWDWLNEKPKRPKTKEPEPPPKVIPESERLTDEEREENLRRMREKIGGMF